MNCTAHQKAFQKSVLPGSFDLGVVFRHGKSSCFSSFPFLKQELVCRSFIRISFPFHPPFEGKAKTGFLSSDEQTARPEVRKDQTPREQTSFSAHFLGACVVQGNVSVKTYSLKLDYPDAGDEMQLIDQKTLLSLKNNRFLSAVDAPSGTSQKHLLIKNNLFDLPGVPHAVLISNAAGVTLRGNVYLCYLESAPQPPKHKKTNM